MQYDTSNFIKYFKYWFAGESYWCRNSEILWSEEGLLFCPSIDGILLRVPQEDAVVVEDIPIPGGSCYVHILISWIVVS